MNRRTFLQTGVAIVSAAVCTPAISKAKAETRLQFTTTKHQAQHHLELSKHSIVHRYPNVPLVLNGTLVNYPEELAVYNDIPLYYTPINDGSTVMLAAFTSRDNMLAASKAESNDVCVTNPYNLPEEAKFYQDIDGAGKVLKLRPGYGYRDLTRIPLFYSTWNDKISSVDWCRWPVTLYEHVDYGGSQIQLGSVCTTMNLELLGWNDRASSVINWGRE